MSHLQQRFVEHFSKFGQKTQSAHFLLAVSGGVDSMVLAHLFNASGIRFAVAHCNFKLRNNEADLDEKLVKDWCLENSITFHRTEFATGTIAEDWKKGIQETARILRYNWFNELITEYKYDFIATAHHLDDNVETLLLNLFRGTGLAGLHGIQPINGNIIRPLLFANKKEIELYSEEQKIPYRTDASNLTDDYSRNAIRRNIVPAIEQWFPDATKRLSENIDRFKEAELLYEKGLKQYRKKLIEQRGKDFYIPVRKLAHCHPLNTIIYELTKDYGFTPNQAPQIAQLMNAESGHAISSLSHRIIKNRDFFIVTSLPGAETDFILIESLPAEVTTEKSIIQYSIVDAPKSFSNDKNVAYFDISELQFPFILRKWKIGDYFYPFGMGMKKKKVARVLINEKVPIHEKEYIFVLEHQKKILWLAGIRTDERFKIKPSTLKVMKVVMKPNSE